MEKSKWISHSSLTNHNYCSNNHKCCNCNSYRLFCCILLEIVHLTSDTFQAIDIHCFLSVFFISVFYACSTYWYSYSNTECLIVISYAPNYANPISLAPAQYSCSRTICSLLETEITNIVQSKNRRYYTILISKEKNNNEWQFQESVRPLIPFSNTHSINDDPIYSWSHSCTITRQSTRCRKHNDRPTSADIHHKWNNIPSSGHFQDPFLDYPTRSLDLPSSWIDNSEYRHMMW